MKIKLYFLILAVVYAFAYTWGAEHYLDEAIIAASVVSLCFGLILAGFSGELGVFKPGVVWLFVLPLAGLNLFFAFDALDTALRWVYFLLVLKLCSTFVSIDRDKFFNALVGVLPVVLLFIMLCDALYRYFVYTSDGRYAAHVVSCYANYVIVLSFFFRRLLLQLVAIALSLLFIYYSGSRGALLSAYFLLLVFPVGFFVRGQKSRALLWLVVLVCASVFATTIFQYFSDIKVAEGLGQTGAENLERSFDDRMELVRQAWGLVQNRPMGWGLGNSHALFMEMKVHSVWLILLLNFGFILGGAVIVGIVILPFVILFSRNIDREFKLLFLFIYCAYFLRASVEPQSPFDTGSPWSLIFQMVIVYSIAYHLGLVRVKSDKVR